MEVDQADIERRRGLVGRKLCGLLVVGQARAGADDGDVIRVVERSR